MTGVETAIPIIMGAVGAAAGAAQAGAPPASHGGLGGAGVPSGQKLENLQQILKSLEEVATGVSSIANRPTKLSSDIFDSSGRIIVRPKLVGLSEGGGAGGGVPSSPKGKGGIGSLMGGTMGGGK